LKDRIDPAGPQIAIRFSTKAWYAAFLLSKDSMTGPDFLKRSAVFQQKPGTQLFFIRKT